MSTAIRPWLAWPATTPTPASPAAQRSRSVAGGGPPLKRFCQLARPIHMPAKKNPGRLVPGMIGTAAKPRSINLSAHCA